jgi:Flp pilus assembly pilin Flp
MNDLLLKVWLKISDERAATATEYSIMLVLILLVAFSTIIVLGRQVDSAFEKFVALFQTAQS